MAEARCGVASIRGHDERQDRVHSKPGKGSMRHGPAVSRLCETCAAEADQGTVGGADRSFLISADRSWRDPASILMPHSLSCGPS